MRSCKGKPSLQREEGEKYNSTTQYNRKIIIVNEQQHNNQNHFPQQQHQQQAQVNNSRKTPTAQPTVTPAAKQSSDDPIFKRPSTRKSTTPFTNSTSKHNKSDCSNQSTPCSQREGAVEVQTLNRRLTRSASKQSLNATSTPIAASSTRPQPSDIGTTSSRRRRESFDRKQRIAARQAETDAGRGRRGGEKAERGDDEGVVRQVQVRARTKDEAQSILEFAPQLNEKIEQGLGKQNTTVSRYGIRTTSLPPIQLAKMLRLAMARFHPDKTNHLTLRERIEAEEVFALFKLHYERVQRKC